MIKKIKKGALAKISSGTIFNDEDYEIDDFPRGGITNAQMELALTDAQEGFYLEGSVYLCTDDGDYGSKGRSYKFTQSGWEDVTPYKDLMSSDGIFSKRPRVKTTDEESSEVLLADDASDFVASESETSGEVDKYYADVVNEGGEFSVKVMKDGTAVHSIVVNKNAVTIDGKSLPTVKKFTNVSLSSLISQLELAKVRQIKLKFRADTNFYGVSYNVTVNSEGISASDYASSPSALIATANETLTFYPAYAYESNYEFISGNYKLQALGGVSPKIGYCGIKYRNGNSDHWITASTSADFNVDAEVELD